MTAWEMAKGIVLAKLLWVAIGLALPAALIALSFGVFCIQDWWHWRQVARRKRQRCADTKGETGGAR